MLREAEKRRPTFREGIPIPLCNGEGWHFRQPVMRYRHRRNPDTGELEFGTGRLSLGPKFDELVDRIIESDSGVVRYDTALNLAALILALNYDLTDDDLNELLPCIPDDETNAEMWTAIVGVALGQAPKRS